MTRLLARTKPSGKPGYPVIRLFHCFSLKVKNSIFISNYLISAAMSFPPVKSLLLPGFISLAMITSGTSVAGELLGSGTGVIDPRRDSSTYTLESSVVCPNITVGGGIFAGNGNQWGNNDIPYNSASGGGSNIGGVAGITIPLGGSLADYCRNHAKMRSAITKLELELSERKVALNFLEQCVWVQTYFPGYNKEEFRYIPQFKMFQSCPNEKSRDLAEGVRLDESTNEKGNVKPTRPTKQNPLPPRAPSIELRSPANPSPVQLIR